MSTVIGIDLGTTSSSAAHFIDGNPKMILDERKKSSLPSVVSFDGEDILVGDEARYQMITNSENAISQTKRLIGKYQYEKGLENCSLQIRYDNTKKCMIKTMMTDYERLYYPEEISALIIKKLKSMSENFLNTTSVKDAVISVPANFNNNQRAAIRDAGRIAGLNGVHLINEPTAAALAYGIGRDRNDTTVSKVLVFDLGGGTFDVSILKICGREFDVLATKGDCNLGGEDITKRMMTHLMKEFTEELTQSMTDDVRCRIRDICEKAKKCLSEDGCNTFRIELRNLFTKRDLNPYDFAFLFTKEKFEEINEDLFLRTMQLVDKCMEEEKLKVSDISEILLVGGSTKIPKIRRMLGDKFTAEKIRSDINPDEAVAMGAAIQAGRILSKDEAVKDIKLKEVIPLDIRVRYGSESCYLNKIFSKDCNIPSTTTRRVKTLFDNQLSVSFSIYERPSAKTEGNILLGEFVVENLPSGEAGSVNFDVNFNLDENAILSVNAAQNENHDSPRIGIKTYFKRLSNKQVKQMVRFGTQNVTDGPVDDCKQLVKRHLDRYCYDVYECLLLKTTQNEMSSFDEIKCRYKYELIRKLLSNRKNAKLSDIKAALEELKSTCDPILNGCFKEENNRNIGEL